MVKRVENCRQKPAKKGALSQMSQNFKFILYI